MCGVKFNILTSLLLMWSNAVWKRKVVTRKKG